VGHHHNLRGDRDREDGMKIDLLEGRVVVFGDGLAWAIATSERGVGSAGPGYIFRLREGRRVIVDDSKRGHGWVNDPAFGGLGTFGFHLARRQDTETEFRHKDQVPLRDNAWPVDNRAMTPERAGFGVVGASLLWAREQSDGRAVVVVNVVIGTPWHPDIVTLRYEWQFWGRKALLSLRVICDPPVRQYFIKEPKVCFSVDRSARCAALRAGYTKTTRGLPKTAQASIAARTAEFIGSGLKLSFPMSEVFPGWAKLAAQRARFADRDGPGDEIVWDCHDGMLKPRYELVGWREGGGYQSAAMLLCAWQGGRGPYLRLRAAFQRNG
jgi:hypothetical protein